MYIGRIKGLWMKLERMPLAWMLLAWILAPQNLLNGPSEHYYTVKPV